MSIYNMLNLESLGSWLHMPKNFPDIAFHYQMWDAQIPAMDITYWILFLKT